MRHSHSCPKCGGSKIVFVPGKAGAYGSGNNIPVGLTIFSSIPVGRYVCCSCGYSEEWIDQEHLSDLLNRFS